MHLTYKMLSQVVFRGRRGVVNFKIRAISRSNKSIRKIPTPP